MALNGIDISSYQAGINLAIVPCDFVIIKVTQGTRYVNAEWKRQAEQAINTGKLVAFYHYAEGTNPSAEREFFLKQLGGYAQYYPVACDWEQANNIRYHVSDTQWVSDFMSGLPYSKQNMIYCSALDRGYFDHLGHPMWIAQYADTNPTGYQTNPWNEANTPCTIRQYSGTGRLNGWGENLDLNKFYGDKKTWYNIFGQRKNIVLTYDKDNPMQAIIQPNDEPRLVWFDGSKLHSLTHPDQVTALQEVAKACGTTIPTFKLGTKKAPWYTRLKQAVDLGD